MTLQPFLPDALRAIKAATGVSGGDLERALFWYRNQRLAAFAYSTAEQLVASGRTDELLAYIDSLNVGAAG